MDELTIVEEAERISGLDELRSAFEEIQQPRSQYQLEHFVVNSHDTPERQYIQCVTELKVKQREITRLLRQRRRNELEAEKKEKELKQTHDRIERELVELDLADLRDAEYETDLSLLGNVREFLDLYEIFEEMEHFTHKELQAAEPGYWPLRLGRQMAISNLGVRTGFGAGNLEAAWEAGLLPVDLVGELTAVQRQLEAEVRRRKLEG